MDSQRADPMCCYKHVSIVKLCGWLSLADIIVHLFTSVYLTELALDECIFIPFVIFALFIAFLSALYYVGLHKDNDCLMIPMIVAKVLFVLMIGLFMLFSWIAFLLSLFSLVQVKSPIDSLTTCNFLVVLSVLSTVIFILMLKILFLLHDAYRFIKKQNDHKRLNDNFVTFMHNNTALRPTFV
ncbi:unnamed protein product [Anisakis simplex]|uniref:MARVEL domain-containing protein n=1 Tax=Anisakis simplex TaxID=6269 RepID=A0A0M3JSJ0_ANISI|nr:unnamed protein product [Anisakis simplex]